MPLCGCRNERVLRNLFSHISLDESNSCSLLGAMAKHKLMNPGHFFAELKRRNVYKVAVAYAVVGWLVMQVASTVVPALHLPDSITTIVVVLVLLGFPIALVIAWAFELTPEGIKRAHDMAPFEQVPQRSTRKFTALIVSI